MPVLGILASSGSRQYWIAYLSNIDIAGLTTDSSNNLFVAGHNAGANLVAQKPDGSILWQKQITGSAIEYLYYNNVFADTSGNVYGCGYDGYAGARPSLFTKYNSSGTLQLQRNLTASSSTTLSDIKVDSSGNMYVSGQEVGSGGTTNGYFIAKYNSSGTIQWQTYLESSGVYDGFRTINLDSSGNIYGVTGNYGFVAKYNNSGSLQWQRNTNCIGGFGALDSSNNVYVACEDSSYNACIVKYNSSGTVQWQRKLSTATIYQKVSVDSSDNVYAAGLVTQSGKNGIILAKYNSSGTIQWQRTIFGSASSSVATLKGLQIDIGDKIRIGYLLDSNSIVMTLPSDGNLTGTYTVSGIGIVYATSTFTDAAGTLTPTTSTFSSGTSTATSSTSTYTDSTSNTAVTKTVI